MRQIERGIGKRGTDEERGDGGLEKKRGRETEENRR